MRLAIGNILLCLGVLAFAVLWENWSKPDVVKRIIAAAKPDATSYGRGRRFEIATQSRRLDGIPQGKQGR